MCENKTFIKKKKKSTGNTNNGGIVPLGWTALPCRSFLSSRKRREFPVGNLLLLLCTIITKICLVASSLKASIHFVTHSCGQISCYGKPVERTNEIISRPISLVRFTGFPQQLIWSYDWVREWIGALHEPSAPKGSKLTEAFCQWELFTVQLLLYYLQ